jgi:hypothetical protein
MLTSGTRARTGISGGGQFDRGYEIFPAVGSEKPDWAAVNRSVSNGFSEVFKHMLRADAVVGHGIGSWSTTKPIEGIVILLYISAV